MPRPPLPPFTHDTAVQKVRLAADAWNSRDPLKAAAACSVDHLPIAESERLFRWPSGRRPDDHPGLTELGL